MSAAKARVDGASKVAKALDQANLVKPHLSTRIFRSYIVLLRRQFPKVEIEKLVEECGLPLSHLESNDNWVSVAFALKFTQKCIVATGRTDFPLLAGKISTDVELTGWPLHFLVSRVFSLNAFYSKIPFYASSFNTIARLVLLDQYKNGVKIKFEKNPNFSDYSITQDDLITALEQGCQNMVGYFSSIPTVQGLPPAKVHFKRGIDSENYPSWEISITYQAHSPIVELLIPVFIFALSLGIQIKFANELFSAVAFLVGMAGFFFFRFWNLKSKVDGYVLALKDSDDRYQEIYSSQVVLLDLIKSYSRFLSPSALSLLNKKSIFELGLSDNIEKEMTVMFCDIRNFSKISESLGPKKTFEFINNFLAVFSEPIHQHGGFVDKFTGDGIMAIFPESALNAVKAGLGMIQNLRTFKDERLQGIGHNLNLGIGINTGRLVLGTVGSERFMQTTVFSDAVNISARLESYCKIIGVKIIIGQGTYLNLPENLKAECRYLGKIQLPGKEQKVSAYECYSHLNSADKERLGKTAGNFKLGVEAFESEKYAEAATFFREVLQAFETDLVSKFYLDTISNFNRRKTDSAA